MVTLNVVILFVTALHNSIRLPGVQLGYILHLPEKSVNKAEF